MFESDAFRRQLPWSPEVGRIMHDLWSETRRLEEHRSRRRHAHWCGAQRFAVRWQPAPENAAILQVFRRP
jgi:hypothetical protein